VEIALLGGTFALIQPLSFTLQLLLPIGGYGTTRIFGSNSLIKNCQDKPPLTIVIAEYFPIERC
jgi:hypothetical protein